ncbi:MAG: hypothetical protein JWM16_4243 [Verrucomicrobiales bacterium]|nr:hypothetical protein [Verrucomicrobiales bacterium]
MKAGDFDVVICSAESCHFGGINGGICSRARLALLESEGGWFWFVNPGGAPGNSIGADPGLPSAHPAGVFEHGKGVGGACEFCERESVRA